MIRCIIVDDEPLAIAQLEKYVERVPFLVNVGACTSATEAMEILSSGNVDAMFVDINMPDIDGVQFVRSLTRPPLVVFTTAYSEYAIEGFKLDAIDYLLKPIAFEDFLKAANKLNRLLGINNAAQPAAEQGEGVCYDCLYVKSDYRMLRVPINSIKYIESMSEYVRIFVDDSAKPIVSLLSMKKIEESLPTGSFMRVHRSFLVNLNKVKEISKMRIVYDGGVYVPIGEMYKEQFFEYIDKFFVGKGK
ncbi:MAG: response regulator transcription factor [Bacteroidaceae bacterium]|nr:response regulator transcription factor [Bacteroidaceae bacterium]